MTPEQQAAIIEAVARAIYDADNAIDGDRVGDMLYEDFRIGGDREGAIDQVMRVCASAAAAAIAAHERALADVGYVIVPREPSESMIEAARDTQHSIESVTEDMAPSTGVQVANFWRAMIDAAAGTREGG
jgi:hypothetical protein